MFTAAPARVLAVGADDGVHGLAKHIEGNAQGDIEKVLLGEVKGLLVHPAAEGRQNGVCQQQVQQRHHQAGDHAQRHGAADAAVGVLLVPGAQADADVGAAAVADHDGHRQGHHRQGKHHRVGGVAVGAQVGRVGDEDLVHNVVQRRHQQRNDTGDGVFPH